jgi:hypothetical protein
MNKKRYTVYVNHPHNEAVGHVEGCPHAKVWGGETTGAGGHVGPLGSREEAEHVGRLSGKPFKWCGHCSKKSK